MTDETTGALDLPWKLEDRPGVAVAFDGVYHEWGVQDAKGRELVYLRALRGGALEPIQAARAQHILRAVNAFEPMREALEAAKIELEGWEECAGIDAALEKIVTALRAADGEGAK